MDPRNVGSVFRLADATGARVVLAGTTPLPPNTKINKTARSTVASVDYRVEHDAVSYLRARKRAGAFVLALEWTDNSESLLQYTPPTSVSAGRQPVILIPGSEKSGVAQALLGEVDAAVHLPMYGRNTSLNVAMATGVATYWLVARLGG